MTKKIIAKRITAEKFVKLCKKFKSPQPKIEDIKKLNNGDLLARIIDEETGKTTDYHLKSIFIRKFNFPYSCHKKTKEGKELLISNMQLPPVKL